MGRLPTDRTTIRAAGFRQDILPPATQAVASGTPKGAPCPAGGGVRPHVSIKGWAAGFAACVLINRWTHAPGVSDVQWLHYALIGAGVVLTLLWFN